MPTMCSVTSGPSASSSIALLAEPGAPAKRAPKLLRRVAAAVGKLDARMKWRRMVLPTCRSSRSASTKLAVASSMARGFAVRPLRISIRSMRDPRRPSAGMTGKRSTGPTRCPVPVAPVNTRLAEARALSRTWGSRATSSRFTAPARPNALRPATTASLPRIVRVKSRYALLVLAAPASRPRIPPPAIPAMTATPSHAAQRRRNSVRSRSATAAIDPS